MLLTHSLSASAIFHLWRIVELYSNADGTVQFIELFTVSPGQEFVAAHNVTSQNPDLSARATFTFPSNSPAPTTGKNLLIATAGFAAAAGIQPDYVLQDGFMNVLGGRVNFVGAHAVTFGAFPADASLAIQGNGSVTTATPTNFAGETGVLAGIDPNVALVSSVLPTSRSVEVGSTATAFATVINGGTGGGVDCSIAPISSLAADFFYQTTDPATNSPVGAQNTPVDIAAGALQTFVFGFAPTAAFGSTDAELRFGCANSNDATVVSGINTLQLSASDTPIPDIVALSATVTNDGIVHIPGAMGTGFFALASVNVGAGSALNVSADTAAAALPLEATLCQTDPATSACTNPVVPTTNPVAVTIAAGETPTFAIFVTGSETIALDPAGKRIFVRFRDNGDVTRGSTSVAVQTD